MVAIFLGSGRSAIAQTGQPVKPTTGLSAIQKKYRLDPNSSLISRLSSTPETVMHVFRKAGMEPTEHKMTEEEMVILSRAIDELPPLHQQVMHQHLKSISFVDNMPNSAITMPINRSEGAKLFHIAFRAGILHQTVSEWVTEKEGRCYTGDDSTISVSIQAGVMSALTYVLLHEGTHVVDGSLGLLGTTALQGRSTFNEFTANFAKQIWSTINILSWSFTDSLFAKNIFRPGGKRLPLSVAEQVYRSLAQTPFVSLYATASWHEDLAELLTIYHLTRVLNQPFRVRVEKNGKEIARYEPALSPAVQQRFALLTRFYGKSG